MIWLLLIRPAEGAECCAAYMHSYQYCQATDDDGTNSDPNNHQNCDGGATTALGYPGVTPPSPGPSPLTAPCVGFTSNGTSYSVGQCVPNLANGKYGWCATSTTSTDTQPGYNVATWGFCVPCSSEHTCSGTTEQINLKPACCYNCPGGCSDCKRCQQAPICMTQEGCTGQCNTDKNAKWCPTNTWPISTLVPTLNIPSANATPAPNGTSNGTSNATAAGGRSSGHKGLGEGGIVSIVLALLVCAAVAVVLVQRSWRPRQQGRTGAGDKATLAMLSAPLIKNSEEASCDSGGSGGSGSSSSSGGSGVPTAVGVAIEVGADDAAASVGAELETEEERAAREREEIEEQEAEEWRIYQREKRRGMLCASCGAKLGAMNYLYSVTVTLPWQQQEQNKKATEAANMQQEQHQEEEGLGSAGCGAATSSGDTNPFPAPPPPKPKLRLRLCGECSVGHCPDCGNQLLPLALVQQETKELEKKKNRGGEEEEGGGEGGPVSVCTACGYREAMKKSAAASTAKPAKAKGKNQLSFE